jgi:Protein of unknown function (DUF3570)
VHLRPFRSGARGPLALLALAALGVATPVKAQDSYLAQGEIDVDFLLNYYTQDGDHSPVTGGIGTEAMDVVSALILVDQRVGDTWSLSYKVGVDSISSASVDNIDFNVSSASRLDARTFTQVTGIKQAGENTYRLVGGFSTEYDYKSASLGAGWSRTFHDANTTLSIDLRRYADTVKLIDIDGVDRGDADRDTTDLSIGLTQILGRKTLLTAELFVSEGSGYLATPFHEVILSTPPSPNFPMGRRVQERLPDSRSRRALGLGLNHAFSERVVLRSSYRFYDDDWGIRAHTIELEPHFLAPWARDTWIYPILRWHTQTAADWYGEPMTFTGDERYYTVDPDLSDLTSRKWGIGSRIGLDPSSRQGWRAHLRYVEGRFTLYSRDDGLDAVSTAFSFGWRL